MPFNRDFKKLSTEDLLHQAAVYFPSQFKGKKKLSHDLVREFRMSNLNKSSIESLKSHNRAIIPLARQLKSIIDEHLSTQSVFHQNSLIQLSMIDEISKRLKKQDINYDWLLSLYFRYVASISDVSREEMEVFSHLINQKSLTKLMDKSAWTKTNLALSDIFEQEPTVFSVKFKHLNNEDLELIDELLDNALPAKFMYPLHDISKTGLAFMTYCYLNHVFPLGMECKKKTEAHGAKLSPASFMLHDALHAISDIRSQALKHHIANLANNFARKQRDSEAFIRFYLPYAIHRYNGLMIALNRIFNICLMYLLHTHNKKEFKKIMAGFFLIVHEYGHYQPEFFEYNNLDKVIKQISDNALSSIISNYTVESNYDPLLTCPLTGKSELDKDQIIWIIVTNELLGKRILQDTLGISDKEAVDRRFILSLITESKVSATEMFIDVEITLKNKHIVTYQYPTLNYRWLNANDSIAILKAAGIEIEKPDLSYMELDERREVAQDFLYEVQIKLQMIVSHFKSRATSIANLENNEGNSLADDYFKWQFNLQQKIDKKSSELIANSPEIYCTNDKTDKPRNNVRLENFHKKFEKPRFR